MSLQGSLSVADSGLSSIARALAVVSQNVSNASTPGYTREVSVTSSVTAGGVGMGVRTLPTTRDIDIQLQQATLQQSAAVSGLTLTQSALQSIDSVQGTTGGSGDLASLVGALHDAFATLQAAPESQTQQSKVVAAAGSLAQQVNALSQSYTTARQNAQDGIVSDVTAANQTLAAIGQQSNAIMRLKASGQSTAELENQRDASMQTLSGLLDVRYLAQPDGDMKVLTPSGLELPVHGTDTALTTGAANLAPGASYPSSLPAISLGGLDVTARLTGGRIGAAVALRDTTLPLYQGELDEFAATLSNRLDAQGLTLFSNPDGTVPASAGTPPVQQGYVGYATTMQVNPAVAADPSMVRDGTHAVAGDPAGASAFTPNPPAGPVGSTAMIARVLDYSFGTQVQDGVAQAAPNVSGLGPTGALNAPFAPPTTLAGFATAIVASEAADSATATSDLTTAQAVHTSLQSKLDAVGSVSIDTEMSTMIGLQNAYGANARVITAMQSLFQQTLGMVTQ